MNVSCPECRSVFRIDPAKVPGAGVRARCNVCGAVLTIEHTGAVAAAPADDVVRVATPRAEVAPRAEPAIGGTVDEVRPPTPTVGTPVFVPAPTSDVPALPPRAVPEPPAPEPRARPVNPYLNNTPELRARRLARALVSDLVAYNPQKREQGLRDGTLRQLFRDEIRKSWDEYVEQVGAGVAESTPHFQDALNDVLAGGRRVF